MRTGDPYKDGFLAIAEDLRKQLAREGEPFLGRIANTKSIRDSLCSVYNILKKMGKLTDLKDLDEEEKKELKAEARRLCRATDVDTLMDVCRAFHALGTFIQLQKDTQ